MSTTSAPSQLDVQRAMDFIGDHEQMLEMLGMFEQSLATDIALVWEKLDAGDVAGAQRILHPLKGFVPVFCTDSLIDLVATVEALSKDSNAEVVRAAFGMVSPQLEKLREEVQLYLKLSQG